MQERPRCQVKDCNEGAMLVIHNMMVCGGCYMKYEEKQRKAFEKAIGDL